MLETAAKWTIIIFGLYFIGAGFIMVFSPEKAKRTIAKAGSTNFINYTEITLRMIPAIALIFSAHISRFPVIFSVFGWFMLCTSLILYFVPRQVHHNFSAKAAHTLKPSYLRIIAPFAFAIGTFLIYSIC